MQEDDHNLKYLYATPCGMRPFGEVVICIAIGTTVVVEGARWHIVEFLCRDNSSFLLISDEFVSGTEAL